MPAIRPKTVSETAAAPNNGRRLRARNLPRETLWPELQALSLELRKHLSQITERAVREAIHGDVSEAVESDGPKALAASNRT